jgi:hypothetical protein
LELASNLRNEKRNERYNSGDTGVIPLGAAQLKPEKLLNGSAVTPVSL